MDPRIFRRIEGIVAFAIGTAAYFTLDAPLWLFLVLALAPDISMVGYLAGTRIGSTVYNVFHTYSVPAVLGAVGILTATAPLLWIGLVWAAHIGVDRAVGYGLKYPSGFKHTHLSDGGTKHDPQLEEIGVTAGTATPRED